MAIETGQLTADELLGLRDDGLRHELIGGRLTTMAPAGAEHGDLTSIVDGSLGPFVRTRILGRVLAGDVGFILATDPDTVRAPDIAFVRLDRWEEAEGRRDRFFAGAPDLAVEVISPSDRYSDVRAKTEEWLAHGCRMVLVIDPRARVVEVWRPDQPMRTLGVDDTIDGADVVPGWTLPVRLLFGGG